MPRKSYKLGAGTSPTVEILNVSKRGLWLLANKTEFFLPYDEFPWFRDARVEEIFNVELRHAIHLYWPKLDVDLHIDSLSNLEQFPLVAKQPSKKKAVLRRVQGGSRIQ